MFWRAGAFTGGAVPVSLEKRAEIKTRTVGTGFFQWLWQKARIAAMVTPGLSTIVFAPLTAYWLVYAYQNRKNPRECEFAQAAAVATGTVAIPFIGNIASIVVLLEPV